MGVEGPGVSFYHLLEVLCSTQLTAACSLLTGGLFGFLVGAFRRPCVAALADSVGGMGTRSSRASASADP